jgi:regulator of CtrA degradation
MQTQRASGQFATAFFGRTYDETLELLRQTRDYLRDAGAHECSLLDSVAGLAYSAETSRITARLTNLMAWLLLQRAVHQGEIGSDEARREAPELGRIKVCLDPSCIEIDRLPVRLAVLIDRSDRLYRRIMRLDEMIRRDAPETAPLN